MYIHISVGTISREKGQAKPSHRTKLSSRVEVGDFSVVLSINVG